MFSKLLQDKGLVNQVFGSNYNFRYQKVGDQLIDEVSRAVAELGVHPVELYSCQQVHTGVVHYADGVNGESFIVGRQFVESDGLYTDRKEVALMVKFADCTPVVLFDPVKKVQAIVHSGWRGTTKQISINALERMQADFGCKLENLVAYVGPSIAQENYEVGPEVYEQFAHVSGRDEFFKPQNENYLLDMRQANVHLLKEAGLSDEQIDVSPDTTFGNGDLHSAREEGPEYGLNAMITMIPE